MSQRMEQEITIFSDTVCRLGEGPTYDPDSDTLYWFDIVGKKLLQKTLSSGQMHSHDLPVMASALAIIDRNRQLLLAEDGLYVRNSQDGNLLLHTKLEADDPYTRSNDARVHPSGAFWIGTMGKKAEKNAGAIYWFCRGELRRLYGNISISNSICFSPDGTLAYYADTARGLMFRVTCDPQTGLPTGEPAVFVDHRGDEGGLDGSVVDAEGVLWNARWGAAKIDAYSPAGTRLFSIDIPAQQPTCPAFIGRNADRMIVTSAWQGLSAEARSNDTLAGQTFALNRPVRGRLEPRVKLS